MSAGCEPQETRIFWNRMRWCVVTIVVVVEGASTANPETK
jgi:hypothetical protein